MANLVVARVSANGWINLFNSSGSTDVIADVAGWFDDGTVGGGAHFHPVSPDRVLDTRIGGLARARRRSVPRSPYALDVAGGISVPADRVSAVFMNTTVTNTTTKGYLTVWPADLDRSRLRVEPQLGGRTETVPNLVLSSVSSAGWIRIYSPAGDTDAIGDVAGWFDRG